MFKVHCFNKLKKFLSKCNILTRYITVYIDTLVDYHGGNVLKYYHIDEYKNLLEIKNIVGQLKYRKSQTRSLESIYPIKCRVLKEDVIVYGKNKEVFITKIDSYQECEEYWKYNFIDLGFINYRR